MNWKIENKVYGFFWRTHNVCWNPTPKKAPYIVFRQIEDWFWRHEIPVISRFFKKCWYWIYFDEWDWFP